MTGEINRMKLELKQRRFGVMSSEEALTLALQADQFATDCGLLDPAYSHLRQQAIDFENYAWLLENDGK